MSNRGFYAAGPFGPDTEDEDDSVLAKAISDVFGIRGDTNMAAYQQVLEDVDPPLYLPTPDYM